MLDNIFATFVTYALRKELTTKPANTTRKRAGIVNPSPQLNYKLFLAKCY
jgi:hypothetical protein